MDNESSRSAWKVSIAVVVKHRATITVAPEVTVSPIDHGTIVVPWLVRSLRNRLSFAGLRVGNLYGVLHYTCTTPIPPQSPPRSNMRTQRPLLIAAKASTQP